jgi:hypothetical protein
LHYHSIFVMVPSYAPVTAIDLVTMDHTVHRAPYFFALTPRSGSTRTSDDFDCIAFPNSFHSPLSAVYSQYLRGQRHNLHETLLPQFAGHRTKDPRPLGISALIQDDSGVVVKFDVRAIPAMNLFGCTHNHCPHNVPLLDRTTGRRAFDRGHNLVAY